MTAVDAQQSGAEAERRARLEEQRRRSDEIRNARRQALVHPPPGPRLVGFGTFAALPGLAIGFSGTITYLLALIVWQLNVDSSRHVVAGGLLPRAADWITSVMYLTAYSVPSSLVLGAVLGLLLGWLLNRVTRSASPLLGWILGVLVSFALVVIVHVLLGVNGISVGFGQNTRLFAIPMIIFLLDGGILGVWLQGARARMIKELDAEQPEPVDQAEDLAAK